MASVLAFPEEQEAVAKLIYDQIIRLRTAARDTMVSNLKKHLRSEKSLQIALVLIADDPTQSRVVAHLPTLVFEDLRCAKLVAARMADKMKEISKIQINPTITRDEFNELSMMVKEVPELIVQAKQAILVEVTSMGDHQTRLSNDTSKESKDLRDVMTKVLTQTEHLVELCNKLAQNMNTIWAKLSRFAKHLSGFATHHNYPCPETALEEGVKRALIGNRKS